MSHKGFRVPCTWGFGEAAEELVVGWLVFGMCPIASRLVVPGPEGVGGRGDVARLLG